eukprot:TRINITY_DN29544_c0_g1_i2.p1 TRINITY_DN29544_c0_g1~~TRINITY_DN29544_c0_g1_i2.p1  ORF type:complete len:323 (+),score=96.53 TRINITY_DN29544_c0_g1_i2:72-971(+)
MAAASSSASQAKPWRIPSALDVVLILVMAWAYAKAKVRWLATTAETPFAATAEISAAANDSALELVGVAESTPASSSQEQQLSLELSTAGDFTEEQLASLKDELQERRRRLNEKLAENEKVQEELLKRQRQALQRRAEEQEQRKQRQAAARKAQADAAASKVMASVVYGFRRAADTAAASPSTRKSSPVIVSGDTVAGSMADGLRLAEGAAALVAAAADGWEADFVEVKLLRPGTDDAPTATLGTWRGRAAPVARRSSTDDIRQFHFQRELADKALAEYHSANVVAFGKAPQLSLWKEQ